MPIIQETGGAAEAGIAAGFEQALQSDLLLKKKKELMEYEYGLQEKQYIAHQLALKQLELDREARAKEWEVKKMELQSKIDFEKSDSSLKKKKELMEYEYDLREKQDIAHRLTLKQLELDRESRAHAWELEKAELRSKFDFEQEEKERLRRKAIATSGLEAINNSGASEQQKDDARFNLWQKFYDLDIPELAKYAGARTTLRPTPEKPVTQTQQRKELEAVVGQGVGKFMSIAELQNEANNILSQSNNVITIPQGETRPLDADTAREILIEANGDKEKARQIARQRGYSF